MRQERRVSREQLYHELWAEPARDVAKRYGISDVGLTKVCRRYQIPKPSLGYWAQYRVGKAPAPSPLTPAEDSSEEVVVFGPGEREDSSPDPPELSREKRPEWHVEVPPDLKLSHPLVKAAAAAFREAKAHRGPTRWQDRYRTQLLRPGAECLDIAVSKALVPRALRIMQALLDALERRRYAVAVRQGETFVSVLGEEFQIALHERLRQVKVQRSWGSGVDCELSGLLRLRVGSSYSGAGPTDRPPRLIETQLNRFIAGLVRRALDAKAERARYQERQRRWLMHDEERRRRVQQKHSEELRQRRMWTLAGRWARHRRLSDFIASVEQRMDDRRHEVETRELMVRWVDWAQRRLRESDPIQEVFNDPWPTAPLPPPMGMPYDWK